ncbi:CPBP family intramembrane metalloprotease [Saccharopolyspora rhizosphaerae]|uniref:CPBP family intramembrane metalloprotease n=1 Tax=Saccharopolyspora rhizosphaerae TaxID=2492662 RepID=A0A3R8NT33_9PSEU|nr:type II CAAX endopeptidase family protein [Saccharopolyspora rhizosphaerae]RRO12671.1 CPBP family intramembrane metalloprotease [Saccharopolyspora rhizosphaerae]
MDVRGSVWFVVLAYLPAWLLSTPLWLTGEGLLWTWAPVALTLMMFTPAVAALVVTKWISPSRTPLRDVGLTNPGGIRKWWRYALLGCVGPLLAMLVALLVGYLLGSYEADWTGFSGLVEQTTPTVVGEQNRTAPTTLALSHLGQVLLFGWVHALPALGEELGWRGYLVKALLPLGQPGAFVTTGVLWGLWHAPILLLGYNYPTVPVVVSFLMMGSFCVLAGTLLSWLRLASDSVWPAVIAHGFLNSAGGMALIFSQAGHPVDNAHVGLLGWSGWIVLVLLILGLVMLGKLPVRLPEVREGISRGVQRRSRKE